MICEAASGERDWYGDFNYLSTELDRFKQDSSLWTSKLLHGPGYGCAGVAVKTTKEALELLGWQDLYDKYKTTKEYYDRI